MQNVTVIIPVYKDWETLAKCLQSLKKYLHYRHKVILINDMSEQWEEIEHSILTEIQNCNNYFYYKNQKNLGFVQTCNRAVFELDNSSNDIFLLNSDTEVTSGFMEEMLEVLYSDQSVGVVCPRSNKATFLSVPFHYTGTTEITAQQSFQLYNKIRNKLPNYEEIWTGVGFAFLIKRKVIDQFGLFDEAFGRGYNEENDFCMRIKQNGWSVMKANHAFVFHYEGKSFSNEKIKLDLINSSLLLRKYPYYWDKSKEYEMQTDPLDYFSELLLETHYPNIKILFYIAHVDDNFALNKNIENIKKILFNNKKNFQFQIYAEKKYVQVLRKQGIKINIIEPDEIKDTYHIICSLTLLNDEEKQLMNLHGYLIMEGDVDPYYINNFVPNMILDIDMLTGLRFRWKNYLKSKRICKDNIVKKLFGKIKKHLYMHHIWIFICWNKLKGII